MLLLPFITMMLVLIILVSHSYLAPPHDELKHLSSYIVLQKGILVITGNQTQVWYDSSGIIVWLLL